MAMVVLAEVDPIFLKAQSKLCGVCLCVAKFSGVNVICRRSSSE